MRGVAGPAPDDNRGNLHVGATAQATTLTPREEEIVARLAPDLKKADLFFVGIDVIGDTLTEINVTSPTGILEANKLTGQKFEEPVIDALEARAKALKAG